MRLALILTALLALAGPACAQAVCVPEKMVRIVTTNVTPGVDPASFAAKPMLFYRQGAKFLRTDEAPDPARRLHLLIVMESPDVWFVNRADNTGRHIVDPGPTYDLHAPLLSGPGVPPEFARLEFGCEARYAAEHPSPPVAGAPATMRRWVSGGHVLELAFDSRGRPSKATYTVDGKIRLAIRYDEYAADLPLDRALFARPEGVAYSEERPAR